MPLFMSIEIGMPFASKYRQRAISKKSPLIALRILSGLDSLKQ